MQEILKNGFAVVEAGDDFFTQVCRDLATADRKAETAAEMRNARSRAIREPVRTVAEDYLQERPGLTQKELIALVRLRLRGQRKLVPDIRILREEIRGACENQCALILKRSDDLTTLKKVP